MAKRKQNQNKMLVGGTLAVAGVYGLSLPFQNRPGGPNLQPAWYKKLTTGAGEEQPGTNRWINIALSSLVITIVGSVMLIQGLTSKKK